MKCSFFLRRIQQLLFSVLLSFVIGITCAYANNTDVLQGLGQPQYHSVKSPQNNDIYHLIIRLPNGYDKKSKYPTIYLLDGGISYPLISSYYHYLRFTEEIPEMIIVGISYGTDDWRNGNARSRDYTAKSKEREHWGGAAEFQNLLKTSILPFIESKYASAADKRLIFGNSIAGQFVLYTAMTQPELFFGHIASNPALHRNLPFFINKQNIKTLVSPHSKLFVSSGSNDDAQFKVPALKWMDFWKNENESPWILKTEILENEGHMSAIPKAFILGSKWILTR